jgi:NhaP-type Na+/H+ or K+/H+ antiporter
MFIVVVGRFLAVYISYYIFFCKKSETVTLSFRELSFIAYAAVIRGAIAFGLVTSISDDTDFPHKEII